MKVSNKIISGFLVLTLLAIVVLGNQLTVIDTMHSVNRDLAESDIPNATIVLDMQNIVEGLNDDNKKYFFVSTEPYEKLIDGFRSDFLGDLAKLRETARSESEREVTQKLGEALDVYLEVFNR